MGVKTVTLALTGASGAAYGLRLLECLLAEKVHVQLIVSDAAKIVLATETDFPKVNGHQEMLEAIQERFASKHLHLYESKDWFAPPASGSAQIDAMVVCPCSMGTLSAIAHGASNNLLERAADVMLKEKRPLILVARETPLSSIHLQNMLTLSQAGVTLLPASPGFYYQPQAVADLVDFVVARVLDQLSVPHRLCKRWGETP